MDKIPIILNYGVQHKKVEEIFKNDWPILTADRHLKEILPKQPKRKAPILRNMIAKNVTDSPKQRDFTFFYGKGIFFLQTCYACVRTKMVNKKGKDSQPPQPGKQNQIRDSNNSRTEGWSML